jgi:putative heme-binding domain-containing protein
MQFPKDTVLVKTIWLNVVNRTDKESKTGDEKNVLFKARLSPRVETQLLHFDGEDWHGYTYAWRDDGTDAELVPPEGAEKVFTVTHDKQLDWKREQVWTFHSRTQCMSCHNAWSEYALAFSVGQLNEKGVFPVSPEPNQLIRLSELGYIKRLGKDDKALPSFDEDAAARELSLVDSSIRSRFLESRARSYLHANCAHCHRFGGGGGSVVLELDISKSLKETGILDVRPKQGDFGIADARIIAPGDPGRSVLLYRMAKFGRGRMPHLGSEWPDAEGIELINEWICSLTNEKIIRSARDASGIESAFRDFGKSLPLVLGMQNSLDLPARERVLKSVAKLEPSPIRELFEGYFPPDPKGRKLGSNPRPSTILALTGNAKKGEELFFNKDLKCATCHKVADKGTALGPDLTAIGKTRSRAELLESLLQPSVRIEAQFAAYNVKTLDARTFTGLLVKRDEKQVVLKDAENKEISLATADVESVTPSRLSLMPDGLLAGLTPQEAADLLDFLVSRK